jgi:hypothetical protein
MDKEKKSSLFVFLFNFSYGEYVFVLLHTCRICCCAILVLRQVLVASCFLFFSPSQVNSEMISNQMKSFVEDFTMLDWNWWPLTPRMRALKTNEKRLVWKCVSRDLMQSDQQADYM